MTKTISVKDLRLNFRQIREDLEKGVKFVVIYRSKPIGELTPFQDLSMSLTEKKQLINEWPDLDINLPKPAVDLIREDRD